MRLQPEHLNVLDALRPLGGPVTIDTIVRSLQNYRHPEFYTPRRVYAVLDQLESLGMVAAWAPIHNVTAVWKLTKKGLQCLTETHH